MDIVIRQATAEDERQAISLLRDGLGVPDFDEAFWNWRYRQHPAGPGIVLVAANGTEVVGVVGAFPQDMWVAGRQVKGWFLNDDFVQPEWRGQGIFSMLFRRREEFIRESSGSILFSLASKMSYPAYVNRFHYHHVATVPYRVATIGRSRNPLSALGIIWPRRHVFRALRGVTVRPSVSSAELAEAMGMCSDGIHEEVTIAPTQDFLEWRFYRHPWHKYEVIVARNKSGPVGYAVLRRQNLLMVGCRPDKASAETTIGAAFSAASSAGTQDLHCYLLGQHHVTKVLWRAGFLRWSSAARPFGLYPQQLLMVKTLNEQDSTAAYDPQSWHLQMAHIMYGG